MDRRRYLDIAGFPQSIVKRAQTVAKKVGPFGAEHPDHRHRRLLRARRERPRGRATEKRNELAPPQVEHLTSSQWGGPRDTQPAIDRLARPWGRPEMF